MFPFLPVPMEVAQQGWVQARVEERVRTGNDVTAQETELNPQARYDVIGQGGQAHAVAIYQPRFVFTQTFERNLPDPTLVNPGTINTADPNETPLSALHNGGLGLELLRRRWRLAAYQFAAYGPVTTTALLVQAPWTGEGAPPDPNPIIPSTVAARFTLLFAQTQVFVPIRVSPRVAVIPGFVYNAFGGADSQSRGAMALTSGPGASVAVVVQATRNDQLTSTVGGGTVTAAFEGDRTGATIYRAEASQAWRHWFTANLSTEVSGGSTVGGDQISGFRIYTLGQAAMLYDTWPLLKLAPGAPPQGQVGQGNRLQVGLSVKATPWLDLFSGGLEQRAVGTAAVNYTIAKITLRGQLSSARVFNTPDTVAKYSIFQAEAGVRYRLAPTFSLDGGLRYGSQDVDNAIRAVQTTQTTVFAGLLWAPLPARF
jgi:hypothetical protein